MKPGQPTLPGASKAIRAMVAGPSLVAVLCLAGALAAFLVYPVYGQSGDVATAPSNFTAAVVDGGVILNWSSAVQDAASVTGYQILRRRPREGEGALLVLVADTGSSATTYVDATADEQGNRYAYLVKALRGGEKSSWSNFARIDLPEEADDTEPTPGPASRGVAVQAKDAQAETCTDPAPPPSAVDVTAVPIVVESTTSDYFVLYVSHDVDGTESELPVLVKQGAAGTTTLAENVEALPAERYRVEKYLTADPADVDGDCIDDITELGDPVGMSPVNPAVAIDINDGALAVPGNQTYEALAVGGYFKFGLIGMDTDRPSAYFINAKTHPTHQTFLDDRSINRQRVILGTIAYNQNRFAPDGSQGVYHYSLNTLPSRYSFSFSLMERAHTLLAASMPLLENNLALHVRNHELPHIQSDLPLYQESRIDLVFDGDVYSGTNFLALNPEEGYGLLQVLEPDDRPHPRNIVIYEGLPNELPRVAGIITTVPQTPLSHVNLRAVQDGIPNAYIRNIRDDPAVAPLIGSYVRYEVTDSGWDLRAATKEEVDAHYEASRPQPQTPEQDLSVTEITPLNEIGFDDWRAFGVKAANVAVLGTLDFPEGTVPEGFAIPFHFYDEFMKATGFYGAIMDMLADEDFQTDFDVQDDMLDDLRDGIKDADTPQWIIDALTAMHAEFPAGQSLRYRSSTNNEDQPGFNGAGLYDSKTQDPEETEEDGIDKSLKGVFASLWTFRAFTEREFHRIDHLAAAMGVLVHPNYKDELANGVAVSFDLIYGQDPIYGRDDRYYVNTQVGEDLVTNPEAHSIPEELLLRRGHDTYIVLSTSNLVEPGELLMSDAQLTQLRDYLTTIHDHFKGLYNPGPNDPFAMEIEFKITSEDVLAIKQARPWVFGGAAPPPSDRAGTVTLRSTQPRVGAALTATLTDPDGSISNIIWQWASSPDGSSNWATISGAALATYTPVAGDVGSYLRAVSSYNDGQGDDKTAFAVSANRVQAAPPPPPPPPITGGGGDTVETDEECTDELGALFGTATRSGTWASHCESSVAGRGYARYYSLTLAEDAEVTIGLESSVDAYLYLRQSEATSGTALHENDDVESGNTNSEIVETLSAGTFTIEATTYSEATSGSFTFTVNTGEGGPQSPIASGCSPASLSLPAMGVAGIWDSDCESSMAGRGYARYYSFSLNQDGEATIDLSSSVDTYLYLRRGSATSGSALHENDDVVSGDTNSRIVATLSTGAYTVEATTYSEATTRSFTLSVSGGGSGTPVATGCSPASLSLPANGVSGNWAVDCESSVSGRGYARYYSFTLSQDGEATIDLSSSVDTYLYLREGSATSGTALHDNDDVESGNTNSQIVAGLGAGTYTIEATTYSEGTTGSFTFGVSSGGGTPAPGATGCSPASLSLPASELPRNWGDDCESSVSGRGYARYYSFTLTQDTDLTIFLESSEDTYLYLRAGSATSGTALHDNDDIESGNTNSRIVATLSAGTYTIEATTYSEATTGSFTLSVSASGGAQTPVAAGCSPTALTLSAAGLSGNWASDCESSVSDRGYARYYSLTLVEDGEVTIGLESSVDTYLYLREGAATSGTSLHDNDDVESGNSNSRIVADLAAGTYTIEATTYAEDATGSFTMSVSVSGGGTGRPGPGPGVSAPDLVVGTPTVSKNDPTVGGSFLLTATVRNQGS